MSVRASPTTIIFILGILFVFVVVAWIWSCPAGMSISASLQEVWAAADDIVSGSIPWKSVFTNGIFAEADGDSQLVESGEIDSAEIESGEIESAEIESAETDAGISSAKVGGGKFGLSKNDEAAPTMVKKDVKHVEHLTMLSEVPKLSDSVHVGLVSPDTSDCFYGNVVERMRVVRMLVDRGHVVVSQGGVSDSSFTAATPAAPTTHAACWNLLDQAGKHWSMAAALPWCSHIAIILIHVKDAVNIHEMRDLQDLTREKVVLTYMSEAERKLAQDVLPFASPALAALHARGALDTRRSPSRQAQVADIMDSAQRKKGLIQLSLIVGTPQHMQRVASLIHRPGVLQLTRLSYGDALDMQKVQHVYPFLRSETVDMNSLLFAAKVDTNEDDKNGGSSQGRDRKAPDLQKVLALDGMLLIKSSTGHGPRSSSSPSSTSDASTLTAFLEAVLSDQDALTATNFYARLADSDPKGVLGLQFDARAKHVLDRLNKVAARGFLKAMKKQEEQEVISASLTAADKDSVGRPDLPVLEQFSADSDPASSTSATKNTSEEDLLDGDDPDTLLVPGEEVKGFLRYAHSQAQKVFELDGQTVDGIELHVGDRVKLTHQQREEENDTYFVDFKTRAYVRMVSMRLAYMTDTVQIESRSERSKKDSKESSEKLTINGVLLPGASKEWRVGDRVILPQLGHEIGRVSGVSTEQPSPVPTEPTDNNIEGNRMTVGSVTLADEPTKQSARVYTCVTEPRIQSRAACESRFDAFGRPKPGGPDVWDKPCERDTDCPFFQANKAYKNHRGGCVAGYCEMPLGVTRVGYKQFSSQKHQDSQVYQASGASYMPLCHGCAPGLDAQQGCCDSQPVGKKNYAFELDAFERVS